MKQLLLHITVHLGGGVGKAILGAASLCGEAFRSQIVVLEEPEKKNIIKDAQSAGMQIYLRPSRRLLEELMSQSDIVILNWWDHPLMAGFLRNFPTVPCRMVLWCHVNGCAYPYVPFRFLDKFDTVFFTSAYSYENPLWSREEAEKVREKSQVILGNGSFFPENMAGRECYENQNGFVIGYVGTLNYAKLSRHFVRYCEAAAERIPDSRFLLAGDAGEDLRRDIEESGIREKFLLAGYVEKVREIYLSMDAMGYLLSDQNYGTTENVILEAMAYGIPVVAFDGGVERGLIDNEENGFLIHNRDEFAERMYMLARDSGLRERIGKAGRRKVCERFSCRKNIDNMIRACRRVCEMEKMEHQFADVLGDSPFEWFLCFTGKDRGLFEVNRQGWICEEIVSANPIYLGERKSSLRHFLKYYPEDEWLGLIVSAIAERRREDAKPEVPI